MFTLQHARMLLDQQYKATSDMYVEQAGWPVEGRHLPATACHYGSQPTCMSPDASSIVHHNEAEGERHREKGTGHAELHCNGCGHGLQQRVRVAHYSAKSPEQAASCSEPPAWLQGRGGMSTPQGTCQQVVEPLHAPLRFVCPRLWSLLGGALKRAVPSRHNSEGSRAPSSVLSKRIIQDCMALVRSM